MTLWKVCLDLTSLTCGGYVVGAARRHAAPHRLLCIEASCMCWAERSGLLHYPPSSSHRSILFVIAPHVLHQQPIFASGVVYWLPCNWLMSLLQSLCRTLYKWSPVCFDPQIIWQLSYLWLYFTRLYEVFTDIACLPHSEKHEIISARSLCVRRGGGSTGVFAIRFELQASSGSVAAGPRHLRLGDPHRCSAFLNL